MSPAQNSLLELKLAAIRELNHKEFLCLLGEIPGQPNERSWLKYNTSSVFNDVNMYRMVLYQRISYLLSSPTKVSVYLLLKSLELEIIIGIRNNHWN